MGWRATYRQMRTWLYWSEEHFDDPDLVCYYLMQLTERVEALGRKQPKSINKFRIKFVKPKQLTQQERIDRSKRAWIGGMGKAVKHVTISREEAEERKKRGVL